MPYWDWASTPQMPSFLNDQYVQITNPSGAPNQNFPNPLLRYKFQAYISANQALFPTSTSDYDWYLADDLYTKRNPDNVGADSNFNQANNLLGSAGIKSATYLALTKAANYDDFSSTSRSGPSLESIHDTIHVNIGGTWGHMSMLSYAAFDPVL
jgi:tyrosinase